MTDDVTIRRYRQGDRNAVWTVHDRAFRASPVEFDPELNRYLRRIPEFFLDAGGEFLVATVPTGQGDSEVDPADGGANGNGPATGDETVVGCGGFLPSTAERSSVRPGAPVVADEDTVEVRSVRVDPDHQGRGIDRDLVRDLEDRARDRGFDRVVLDTNVDLTAARGLYRSLGYEAAGREAIHGFELVYFEREL
ncbi:hypothetical protein BRD00_11650 [Halobacteriales archaeon QS_8_69_26]|nr:MAG: hypothetical protein BRD00_11650 [Halobacteriales archaeon QS_8_69_26]